MTASVLLRQGFSAPLMIQLHSPPRGILADCPLAKMLELEKLRRNPQEIKCIKSSL